MFIYLNRHKIIYLSKWHKNITLTDHLKLQEFVDGEWLKNQDESNFFKKISSNETHFKLNVYINNQIFLVWGTENPRIIYKKPVHPQEATV